MDSIGGGIARGLQTGFNIMHSQRQQEENERARRAQEDFQQQQLKATQDQRAFENQRQTNADQRQQDADLWATNEADRSDVRGQLTGLLQRYNYDPAKAQSDPEWAGLQQRSADVNTRRQDLIAKKWKPFLEKQKADADDYITGLNTGNVDPTQDPGRFVKAVTVTTGRPISDFLRNGDQPSKIEQAVNGAMSGIETKNTNTILQNVNQIMAPSLKVGVGQDAPEDIAGPGAVITGKEIVAIVPSPDDPQKMIPVLKVSVRRGNETGSYIAPVTADRSAHPDDTVAPPIDMQKAMDYFGRLSTLAHIVNTPQMREVVDRGIKDSGDEPQNILNAIYATGGSYNDTQRKVKRENVNLGGTELERTVDANTGQVIGERGLNRSAQPRMFAPRSTGVQGTIGAIQQYADENDMTFDEAAQELQSSGVLRSPGGSRGGSGGTKPPSNAEMLSLERGAEDAAANHLGLVRSGKSWVAKDGRPASPDELQTLAKAKAAAMTVIRDNAAKGQRTGGTAAANAATGALPAQPSQQFTAGQVYTNARGQRAKFGGYDANGAPVWLKP